MPRHFLQLWQWKHNHPDTYIGQLLVHSAGKQLKKVSIGDTVWIVLLQSGHLYTLGSIRAAHVCSKAKAARRLKITDIWDAPHHVIASNRAAETARLVDISGLARSLRFTGLRDRLPPRFSGQHFQALRELTPWSAQALSIAFSSAAEIPSAPLETQEDLEPEGRRILLTHVRAERSRFNRQEVLKAHSQPYECDVCGESLASLFGSEFSDCVQVHHLEPLAARPRTPKPSDFALLCANCHMAAHWGRALRP